MGGSHPIFPIFYDPFTFRKHFKNIGRAYREQATTLIEICRLYTEASPQNYQKDDGLQNVFQLADAALSAAGRAKKGKTSEATGAFQLVQEEIKRFGFPTPRDVDPDDYRKKLPDMSTALESASNRDEESTGVLSKVESAFKAPHPSGSPKKVNFVIRKSLHEDDKDQLIIHQEIDNSTTTAEVMWNFSRYPDASGQRITVKQNPHFYLRLPRNAPSFGRNYHKNPLKDFAHGLEQNDTIYVLVDKDSRLFLHSAKPRIFGNLWKPHQIVILKDAGGILNSEDIVLSNRNIGKSQDYWHRPSVTDSSRRRVESTYSDDDIELVNKPLESGHALLDVALQSQSQKVDFMIRDRSLPEPPEHSGWKLFPRAEDQMTPRQSATSLPRLVDSNLNFSAPSIGESTLYTASSTSLETPVNMSDVSLPSIRVGLGKRTQPIDSGIDLHLDLPSADNLTTPPPSAPPSNLTIPSPLSGPDRGLLSAPRSAPLVQRGEMHKTWFQKYVYDYDTESWKHREAPP